MPDSLLDQVNKRGFINLGNLIIPSKIGGIQPGYPAEEAGLKAEDEIVAVDGQAVQSWQELVQHIQSADGALQLTIKRGDEEFEKTITPNENNKIGIAAMQPADVFQLDHQKYGLIGSIAYGWDKTEDVSTSIIQGFGKMFSGDISVRENLGGPVAIANITKEQTDRGGWLGFWNITAFLSITLAIMNILPIPVLDGGHLMFLIYEGITRREPSEKVRMALQQIGFVLIILLFILVTFNDILRLF
jgi:regulator of sigma E protease